MARKKIEWHEVEEGSVVAGVKGFQMPIGAKGKKKNNPSKPYGEDELFEHTVVSSELNEDEVDETIQKVSGEWVIFDPRTGAQVGKASSRDSAREKQRQLGLTQKRKASVKTLGGATVAADALKSRDIGSQSYKPKKKKDGGFAEVKKFLRKTLKEAGIPAANVSLSKVRKALATASGQKLTEGSMLSYVFEQMPPEQESIWEGFIGKLNREHVMSDVGLSESLQAIAMAEARVLARSVMEIKKILEGTTSFMVERCEADQDPESGDVRMPFKVSIIDPAGGDKKDLLFGVKLEHGKPLVLFPEESRYALNNMVTKESKLLRAELMHVQETVLDKFEEVIQASASRDTYLSEMQMRLGEMLEGLNLVETSIMKNLVRKKLKGTK